MILNPSHFILTVPDMGRVGALQENLGAREIFAQEVPVPPQKKALLRHSYLRNRVKYLSFEGAHSCEVEVIEHAGPSRMVVPGNLFPIFASPNPRTASADDGHWGHLVRAFQGLLGGEIKVVNSQGIVTFHCEEGNLQAGVSLVLHFVEDLDSKVRFYCRGFGFKELESPRANRWRLLECKSKVSKRRFRLGLVKSRETETRELIRPHFLDDPGFTCLSFLVSGVERELKKIKGIECEVLSDPMEVHMNGKNLICAFVRDPEGQLIELFQFKDARELGGGLGA
ncbi:MAG: VOC family protein [Nitrospinales bacterium]